ncbi:MAG TPA: hypothetical protein VLC50_04940 [Actinomycetes bacterium]|nr:hypothetical protein [Actinomycetes bacterium]
MARATDEPDGLQGRQVFNGREWVDYTSLVPAPAKRPWLRWVVTGIVALIVVAVFGYAVAASGEVGGMFG